MNYMSGFMAFYFYQNRQNLFQGNDIMEFISLFLKVKSFLSLFSRDTDLSNLTILDSNKPELLSIFKTISRHSITFL